MSKKYNLAIIALFLAVCIQTIYAGNCQNSLSPYDLLLQKIYHMADRMTVFILRTPQDQIAFYLHSIEMSFSHGTACFATNPSDSYQELVYGTNQMTLLVTQIDHVRTIDSPTYSIIESSFQNQLLKFDSLSIPEDSPFRLKIKQLHSLVISNYQVSTELLSKKMIRYEKYR